jgi:Uncharacterised nucleotidyltransferase
MTKFDDQVRLLQRCLSESACLEPAHFEAMCLDEQTAQWLLDEKMLASCAALCRPSALPDLARKQLTMARERRAAYEALESRLLTTFENAVEVAKGPTFARLYPAHLVREFCDLDLIFGDEHSYLRACGLLSELGFEAELTWLVGTPRGLVASTAYLRELHLPQGDHFSLRVEMHLKSFPVTAMSTLFLFQECAQLSPPSQRVALLLAEFVFRDGRKKRFTVRDLIDVVLLFAGVPRDEYPALSAFLKSNSLSCSLLLLSDYWDRLEGLERPALLQHLAQEHASERWQGEYDYNLHQGFLHLQRRGMDTATYEAMLRVYGAMYQQLDGPRPEPAELGFWLGIGMPVCARLVNPRADGLLRGGCELLTSL